MVLESAGINNSRTEKPEYIADENKNKKMAAWKYQISGPPPILSLYLAAHFLLLQRFFHSLSHPLGAATGLWA